MVNESSVFKPSKFQCMYFIFYLKTIKDGCEGEELEDLAERFLYPKKGEE